MKTFGKNLERFVGRLVDSVLPPRCVVSGEIVERQGMVAPQIWAELDFVSAPCCACCGFPFEFEVEDKTQCTACLAHKPPFETARAALKYNEASRSIVLGFKHADKTFAVKAFTPWLKRAGAHMLAEADFLLPVPLHPFRLLARRYNQAALMAFELGKATGVPCLPDALLRTRATHSQGHLSAKERHRNVRRAFAVNPRHKNMLQGKTVILIDDVYTTGSTVRECSKSLLRAGVGRVHILTLARVVHDEFGAGYS